MIISANEQPASASQHHQRQDNGPVQQAAARFSVKLASLVNVGVADPADRGREAVVHLGAHAFAFVAARSHASLVKGTGFGIGFGGSCGTSESVAAATGRTFGVQDANSSDRSGLGASSGRLNVPRFTRGLP